MAPSRYGRAMLAQRFAFPAMLTGSACLAFGPWLVRLADVGAIDAGFWRLSIAILPLFLIARAARQPIPALSPPLVRIAVLAGFFFAADLAVWHLGIRRTTLANSALLSNAASFLLPLYGYWVARTRPTPLAWGALLLAAAGTALLMGQSADVSARHFAGDLFCLAAAVFYTLYLIVIDRMRGAVAALPTLALVTVCGAAAILPMALLGPGPFWPTDWTPVVLLALGSQVVGQGLIVFAIGHLKPLTIGLALLAQPLIASIIGALRFGEMPGPAEIAGAACIVIALVLVRLPGTAAGPAARAAAGRARV